MRKKTVRIKGHKIEITVTAAQTRWGRKYVASNNYGEPKNQVKAFNSIREAMEAEEKELTELLS